MYGGHCSVGSNVVLRTGRRGHRSGHEASEHPRLWCRAHAPTAAVVVVPTPRNGRASKPFLGRSRCRRWRARSQQRRRRHDGFTSDDDRNGGGGGATTMPYASCHLQCSAAGSARTSRDRPSRLVIGATLARAERRTTLTRGGRVPFTNTVAPYLASYRALPLSFFDSLSPLRASAVTLKFTLSPIAETRFHSLRLASTLPKPKTLVYRTPAYTPALAYHLFPRRNCESTTRKSITPGELRKPARTYANRHDPSSRRFCTTFLTNARSERMFGVRVLHELVRNSALYTHCIHNTRTEPVCSVLRFTLCTQWRSTEADE